MCVWKFEKGDMFSWYLGQKDSPKRHQKHLSAINRQAIQLAEYRFLLRQPYIYTIQQGVLHTTSGIVKLSEKGSEWKVVDNIQLCIVNCTLVR